MRIGKNMASVDLIPLAKQLACAGIESSVVTSTLSDDDHDRLHAIHDKWLEDFARLVRKYVPEDPDDIRDPEKAKFAQAVLRDIQDATSCYSPYIWSSKYKPKQKQDMQ